MIDRVLPTVLNLHLGPVRRVSGTLLSCLLCLGLYVPAGFAQEVAIFTNVHDELVTTPYLRWFDDSTRSLTLEEALERFDSGPASTFDGEWSELGFRDAVLWLSLDFRNESSAGELVLEFRNPRMSFVDAYVRGADGQYTKMVNGAVPPLKVRQIQTPIPAFPISLAAGESTRVLIRIEDIGDYWFRTSLWKADAFYNQALSNFDGIKVFTGFLVVLAVYHLLIFFSLRERAYLYLSFFIASWVLLYLANTGFGKVFLWDALPWISLRAGSLSAVLIMTAFLHFCMSFLESRKYTPLLHRWGVFWTWVWGAQFLFIISMNSSLRMDVNRVLLTLTLLFVTVLIVQSIRKGSRIALFFAATWLLLMGAGVLILLLSWYLLPIGWLIGSELNNFLFIGSILLWSFELTGRIKGRVQEQRRLLEEKVAERTSELQDALRDVKTLSGLLPICSACKKIRDDKGYWSSVEHYLKARTDADFTEGTCPDCQKSSKGDLGSVEPLPGPAL